MPLETLADLNAPARSNPAKTVAELCVTRMQSTTTPMPPAGSTPPTAQEIAAFSAWVTAGAMAGSCAAPGADGGTMVATVYNTPVQCSSGVTSRVNEGSRMRPGDTCVSCHAQSGGEAPTLSIGGTVYKTAHEPTNCNGVSVSGATVVHHRRQQPDPHDRGEQRRQLLLDEPRRDAVPREGRVRGGRARHVRRADERGLQLVPHRIRCEQRPGPHHASLKCPCPEEVRNATPGRPTGQHEIGHGHGHAYGREM